MTQPEVTEESRDAWERASLSIDVEFNGVSILSETLDVEGPDLRDYVARFLVDQARKVDPTLRMFV